MWNGTGCGSSPIIAIVVRNTRRALLDGLAERGFVDDQLKEMAKIISTERSDLFDVLALIHSDGARRCP